MPQQPTPRFGSSTAARHAGISLRQLYYWIDVLHIVQPKVEPHLTRRFRRFTSHDIDTLKKMRDLLEWGYTLQAAARFVKDRQLPRSPHQGACAHTEAATHDS